VIRKAFHSNVADATRRSNRLPEQMVVMPRFDRLHGFERPHFHSQDSLHDLIFLECEAPNLYARGLIRHRLKVGFPNPGLSCSPKTIIHG
jgi:hypothetical protein